MVPLASVAPTLPPSPNAHLASSAENGHGHATSAPEDGILSPSLLGTERAAYKGDLLAWREPDKKARAA